jgi:hypothetical protein
LQLKSAKGLEILLDWVRRLGTKNCYKVQSQHNTQNSAFTGAFFVSFHSLVSSNRYQWIEFCAIEIQICKKTVSSQTYFPCETKISYQVCGVLCCECDVYIIVGCTQAPFLVQNGKNQNSHVKNVFFSLASPHPMHAMLTPRSRLHTCIHTADPE